MLSFMRLGIGKRLFFGFFLMLTLEIGIVSAGIFNIHRLTILTRRSINLTATTEAIYESLLAFQHLIVPIKNYVIHGESAQKHIFQTYAENTKKRIDDIKDIFYKEGRPEFIKIADDSFARVAQAADKIFGLESPAPGPEAAELMKGADAAAGEILETLEEYHEEHLDNEIFRLKARARKITKNSMLLFASFSLLGIALTIFLASLLSRRISRPVSELIETCKKISQGEHSRKTLIKTNDEFEELSLSFNRMIDNLSRNEGEIKKANRELAESSRLLEEKVAARTQELENSKQELEKRVADLERINRLTIDRELMMKELKQELQALKARLEEKGG